VTHSFTTGKKANQSSAPQSVSPVDLVDVSKPALHIGTLKERVDVEPAWDHATCGV
jgi:hypothetical protein